MTLGGCQSRSEGFGGEKGPLSTSEIGPRYVGCPACSFLRMHVMYCLICNDALLEVRAYYQMRCDVGSLTAVEGFCPALLLLWGNEGNPTQSVPHFRFIVVVTGCLCRAVVYWTLNVTLPFAVQRRQLLRHSCVAGCQLLAGGTDIQLRCSHRYSGTVHRVDWQVL
jgi:hypothetical protein